MLKARLRLMTYVYLIFNLSCGGFINLHAQSFSPPSPSFPIRRYTFEGSLPEIAEQYGKSFRRYASPKLAPQTQWNTYFGRKFLEQFPIQNLRAYLPEKYEEALTVFARKTKIPLKEVFDDFLRLDHESYIQGFCHRPASFFLFLESLIRHPFRSPFRDPSPEKNALSCLISETSFSSSALIWNSEEKNSIHGVRFRFGREVLKKNSGLAVLQLIPNEGLASVHILPFGSFNFGLLGFNESGLTLSIHPDSGRKSTPVVTSQGVPVSVIGTELLRVARSIDEAIQVIRAYPPAGGYAYVITRGQDRAIVYQGKQDFITERSSEPVTAWNMSKFSSQISLRSPSQMMNSLKQNSFDSQYWSVVFEVGNRRVHISDGYRTRVYQFKDLRLAI